MTDEQLFTISTAHAACVDNLISASSLSHVDVGTIVCIPEVSDTPMALYS